MLGYPENCIATFEHTLRHTFSGLEIDLRYTKDGQIVLRRFPGMHFDRQKLEPLWRDGIKISLTQVRLNPKRLGGEWQKVLEGVLGKI